MKVKTAFGSVLNKSSPFVGRRVNHDIWPHHAAADPSFYPIEGASGAYYVGVLHQLKSGEHFWYVMSSALDYDAAFQIRDGYLIWKNYQGLVGFLGEYYNFTQRPNTVDKFPDTDLDAWIAAH